MLGGGGGGKASITLYIFDANKAEKKRRNRQRKEDLLCEFVNPSYLAPSTTKTKLENLLINFKNRNNWRKISQSVNLSENEKIISY